MINTFVEQEYAERIAFDCMLDTNETYIVLKTTEGYEVKPLAIFYSIAMPRDSREVFRAEA